MPSALELHDGRYITYNAALNKEENILNQILEVSARNKLYKELWSHRHTIEGLVKLHLGLGDQAKCSIAPPAGWIRGSFNVCIPLAIKSTNSSAKRLMFRCAMPHKLAEAKHPGTVDEKVGSEVGTYVWMQSQCPEIRIPHLYGFGFANHLHVSLFQCACLIARTYFIFTVYTRAATAFLHPLYPYASTLLPKASSISADALSIYRQPNSSLLAHCVYAT